MSVPDYLITLAVILVVLFATWRGGQSNPVGTGRLGKRMDALELKVSEQGARLDGVERSVLTLAENVAKISVSVDAMLVAAASDRAVLDKTWAAADRIQNYFIEEAFEHRRRGK